MSVALITGASSGIGAEFVRQLAPRGYRFVLVARRRARLDAVQTEIQATYADRNVEVLTADLATEAGRSAVVERLRQGDVSLLVNNAGFGLSGRFDRIDYARHEAMLRVHVDASIALTHAALPAMIERRAGGVVNVASMAGFIDNASYVLYCATKALLISFSRGLAAEMRPLGIQIQALCPGYTTTEFFDHDETAGFRGEDAPGFARTTPGQVVRASLRALDRRRVICTPGWFYGAAAALRYTPLAPLLFGLVRRDSAKKLRR